LNMIEHLAHQDRERYSLQGGHASDIPYVQIRM
jgi:hypothetical protein